MEKRFVYFHYLILMSQKTITNSLPSLTAISTLPTAFEQIACYDEGLLCANIDHTHL